MLKFDTHQGISFDSWLDLFLDYAVGLAIEYRRDEAYQVLESARDSTVFQSAEHNFIIYVTWSGKNHGTIVEYTDSLNNIVCAIYTNDEERCVTTARHLMRDGGVSDSYRMFAMLSKLCQSPVSWYTSGPAQKYILRQIKAIDARHEEKFIQRRERGEVADNGHIATTDLNVDVCLLMLYGHILFTSTSYTYAIGMGVTLRN